eukprot:328845-Pleurochrysis_carterae.AAC.1
MPCGRFLPRRAQTQLHALARPSACARKTKCMRAQDQVHAHARPSACARKTKRKTNLRRRL